ncbi:hypothetical protein TM49_10400 [Martelella endophytica]|uniref:BrnT family toxin n=1 Tax=Martelella endophytica TaxID=1486262 RepID=A0A0D5LPY3_MAREN|nr:hypothetical protein TM49_10400 [Martelella endophytica]
MEFQWDEVKRQRILAERGVDILYAALIFEGVVLTREDDRRDYGERREISLGMVDDECFVVVHTDRGGIRRLITAWKGGRDERRIYEARVAGAAQKDEG